MDRASFTWPPSWSVAAFLVLLAVVVLLWVALARCTRRAAGAGFGPRSMLAFLAAVVALNLALALWWPWQRAFAPGAAAVMLAALLPFVWLGCARRTRPLAHAVPLWLLVGVQGFRLPLELLLHVWVEAGSIPPAMTWTGQNLDVCTGVLALVAAAGLRWRPGQRWLAWLVQVVGLLLLARVLQVVVRSVPLPWWSDWAEPPLILVAVPPLSLIGPLAVGSALAWHLLALRALLAPAEAVRSAQG